MASNYINTYTKLTGTSKKQIKKWELIIFAARLSEQILEEREMLLKLITKKIHKVKKTKIDPQTACVISIFFKPRLKIPATKKMNHTGPVKSS